MDETGKDTDIIRDYRDLRVWKLAMELAEDTYGLTSRFPREEVYGLTSQMRHCGSSIPANTAEGFGRQQRQSFINYLRIAQGSLKELETHGELARRLGLLEQGSADELMVKCEALGKMLRAFITSLEKGKR